MRIAFVSQGLGRIDPPRAYGSISIWTYGVLKELAKSEHIIAYEMEGGLLRSRTKYERGVTYIYAPTLLNRLINRYHRALHRVKSMTGYITGSRGTPIFASSIHNVGYVLWVALNLRKQQCDVIHIHQFSQYVPIVRFFNPKSKIVLHMNCEWLSQLDPAMIAGRLEAVDAIVGCSTHILRRILEKFPHLDKKCSVVFNGADVGLFVPSVGAVAMNSPDTLRILFVGRISPEKGVHILVEAFKLVAAEYPTARLELVGGTGSMPEEFLVSLSDDPAVKGLKRFYGRDYLEDLRNRIPEGLADRVRFHGSVAHGELAGHYSRATVFAISSLSDAFPLTAIEAMAAGLPVAGSAVGGIAEAVVDESTGLLVEPDNPEALAAALSRLLGDSNLRRRMGSAGRERALRLFSWRAIADQVSRVYDTVVETESTHKGVC
ncbi:MAG: glycosyltransferase family 4 protein [Nitrospirota bacterium]